MTNIPKHRPISGEAQDVALRIMLTDPTIHTDPGENVSLLGPLELALDQLATTRYRNGVRALILTGIENLSRRLTPAAWLEFRRVVARLENQGRPTIAVIDGHAAGPACELSLACHWRIGTRRASFQESANPENVSFIGRQSDRHWRSRLTGIIGPTRTLELILTGRQISIVEAATAGILQWQVESTEQAMYLATQLATTLATRAPLSIEWAGEAVRRGAQLSLEAGLALETGLFVKSVATVDAREGVCAFLEKRPPRFTGELLTEARQDKT